MGTTLNNLCNSCTNIGCEFQSGIVRTECAFYIPPTVEAIPKDQYETRLKADMVAMLEDLRFQAEENIENIYEKDEDNILMLAQHNAFADCFAQYNSLIEERIDALKGRK